MAIVAVGYIPKKISYVYSDLKKVSAGCFWDFNSENKLPSNEMEVIPTFPIESGDEKSKERAVRWASYYYDHVENKYLNKKYFIDEKDNLPIKDIRVLSLEERGQGGRAYKVIADKYYVDLREDVLMDTLLQVGVAPGGILQGEFIWAKMGSQIKLVRIGSELHRLILEFESKKDTKPIAKKDLEIGGVYQDRKKNKAVFCGYVNSVSYSADIGDFKFKKTPIKNALLFYQDFTNVNEMKNNDSPYFYCIKKTHTYIEKINQITIPFNAANFLREKALKHIKSDILNFSKCKDKDKSYEIKHLQSNLIYWSTHLNLYECGQQAVEPFEIGTYLLLS